MKSEADTIFKGQIKNKNDTSSNLFFSVNVYSYLLPNGEELLTQADELFKKLLEDYHRCIAVNEIRPGLIRCDRQLRDYIAEFNFRFTKEHGSKFTKAKRSEKC